MTETARTPNPDAPPLDPHMRALLDVMARQPAVPFASIPIAQSRAALKQAWAMLDRPDVSVPREERLSIDGPHGPVPVFATWPEASPETPLPIAIYIHGGGFCRGDAAAYARQCRYFTREARCLILNVDYRLAPEHPFPQGLQDCEAVWRWALDHGAQLGGDPERIAFFGDSAGANFSAVLSLIARDAGRPAVWQGLIYPAVDLRSHLDYESRRLFDGGYYFLDRDRLYWYFDAYLRDPDNASDFRASPLFAESHADLPPALIVTAECDMLRDEGRLYHDVLLKAGSQSEYREMQGAAHGIMSFSARVPLAFEVQGLIAARLAAALHPPE